MTYPRSLAPLRVKSQTSTSLSDRSFSVAGTRLSNNLLLCLSSSELILLELRWLLKTRLFCWCPRRLVTDAYTASYKSTFRFTTRGTLSPPRSSVTSQESVVQTFLKTSAETELKHLVLYLSPVIWPPFLLLLLAWSDGRSESVVKFQQLRRTIAPVNHSRYEPCMLCS